MPFDGYNQGSLDGRLDSVLAQGQNLTTMCCKVAQRIRRRVDKGVPQQAKNQRVVQVCLTLSFCILQLFQKEVNSSRASIAIFFACVIRFIVSHPSMPKGVHSQGKWVGPMRSTELLKCTESWLSIYLSRLRGRQSGDCQRMAWLWVKQSVYAATSAAPQRKR